MFTRPTALAAAAWCWLAASAYGASVPRPAPDFKINLDARTQISLSQYKGKVVALAFVLTSCPHCQKAIGALSKEQKQRGGQGLQVLASAVDLGADKLLDGFKRQMAPPFPVGYNAVEPVFNFMQHPKMARPSMPFLVFLDRQGVIRSQYEGSHPFLADEAMEANIHKEIGALLEPPRGKGAAARKTPRPAGKR